MWDLNTLIPLNKQYDDKLRAENGASLPSPETGQRFVPRHATETCLDFEAEIQFLKDLDASKR